MIVLIVGWLRRITTRYLITNRRLQIRRGLLAKHVEETRIDRVVDVTVHQGVLDRILQIGAVDFDNASAQQGDLFRFAGVGSAGARRARDRPRARGAAFSRRPRLPPLGSCARRPRAPTLTPARTPARRSPRRLRSRSALSVRSHVKSWSSRPKWP